MTCEQFATYIPRIRLTDDPAALVSIREELDRLHPVGRDSDALVMALSMKRVRLIDAT